MRSVPFCCEEARDEGLTSNEQRWLDERMQLRRWSLGGADRPQCGCAGRVREGRMKVHRNGGYSRYRHVQGDQRVFVEQFLCVVCRQTFTVLPDDMLPYRPIEAGKVEAWLDAEHGLSDEGPQVTEKEKECLRRAACRYAERTPSLIQVLGQMIRCIGPSARRLWEQLRGFGGLPEILRFLAERFKTSLLGDYRCLRRSKPLHA